LGKRLTRITIVLLLTWVAADPMATEMSPPLAFGYQLLSYAVDDSVAIVVTVNATNVGTTSFDVRGVFCFGCAFRPVPDAPSRERRCPMFVVIDDNMDPSLRCESTILPPGQTVSDTLGFTYSPGYFEPCTGQIELEAEFVYGKSGIPTNDAKRAGKDRMRVLIPIS
jgi:hypothetical protein